MKKQTYTVGVTRLAVVYAELAIDADTPEEAAKLASEAAWNKCDGWEVESPYDDGEPYCAVSVSQVTDEAGINHDPSIGPSDIDVEDDGENNAEYRRIQRAEDGHRE